MKGAGSSAWKLFRTKTRDPKPIWILLLANCVSIHPLTKVALKPINGEQNMNSCLRVLSIVLLAGWPAMARAQPAAVVGAKEREAAKRNAQDIMSAYTGGQYARFADLTHRKLLELAGGREKIISKMKADNEKMQATGWAYGATTVGDPKQFAWMEKELVAIIPYSIEYVSPNRKKKDESYLIGVSSDRGKSWTFVEGRRINRENVKDLLPKFPEGINLPTSKEK